jgi:hypothetical protein
VIDALTFLLPFGEYHRVVTAALRHQTYREELDISSFMVLSGG